jgi:type IV pilus assembly protein PilC
MTLGVLILIGIIFWASRTIKGKRLIDAVFLHIPFFSELIKKMNSSRTTRTLSSLLSSGVDVIEAFDVTKNVLQNNYYREVLNKAKAEIQKGSPIARVFIEAENLYPSLVGEMVAVGEETGQLPSMLLRLADFYEEEVGEITKNLTTIIEPILMIFIGAVVGFFAISMIQPMYSMMGGI